MESSPERLEAWKNGDVSAGERRILLTKWLADAWEDYATNHQDEITIAFKKCGMYNDLNGRENHLVKIDRAPEYSVPLKSAPPAKVEKKKRNRKSSKVAKEAKKQKRS